MSRPPKKLLQLVLEGTFRADRHAHLLAGEPLPEKPPYRDRLRKHIWAKLRDWQAWFALEGPDGQREVAREFGALVRALHFGPLPEWAEPSTPPASDASTATARESAR